MGSGTDSVLKTRTSAATGAQSPRGGLRVQSVPPDPKPGGRRCKGHPHQGACPLPLFDRDTPEGPYLMPARSLPAVFEPRRRCC
eukprot:936508-Rhodomonas_salina.3